MKHDLPPAALRLLCSLPVRTHERKPPVRKVGFNAAPARGRSIAFGKPGRAITVKVRRA